MTQAATAGWQLSLREVPAVTLLLVVAAGALTTRGTDLAWLPEGGPGWRWWAGHLLHHGADHFWPNALTFAALATVIERQLGARFLAVWLLVAGTGISAGLAWADPLLGSYAGLSGVNAALAAGLGSLWIADRERRLAALLVLAGLLCYLTLEAFAGARILTDGSRSVPAAHALGAGLGLALGCPTVTFRRTRLSRRTVAPDPG